MALCGTFDFSKSLFHHSWHLSCLSNWSLWNKKAGRCITRKYWGIWVLWECMASMYILWGEGNTDYLWCQLSISVQFGKTYNWEPETPLYFSWFFTDHLTSWLTRSFSFQLHRLLSPRWAAFLWGTISQDILETGVGAEITHKEQKQASGKLSTQASGWRGGSGFSRWMWLKWANEPINDRAESKKWFRKQEKGQADAD